MDSVKIALNARGVAVEAARQCTLERVGWEALVG